MQCLKGSQGLLHQSTYFSPNIIACFDKVHDVLLRVTLAIKLLELSG